MTLILYSKIKEDLHRNPEFMREYEALAEKMGTTQSAVARMESGKSISIRSLRKYARCTHSRITLTFTG